MTAAVQQPTGLLDSRPALRPDVLIGPGLEQGTGTVHHLKDPRTGWYFRVGPREAFLIRRLDGSRTLAEIGAEYATEFGRRLGEGSWQQLLGMLAGRRLLVGTEDDAALAELAAAARRASRGNWSLLRARLPLVDPDRFLGRLAPRLRVMFARAVAVPLALAVLVMEILVLANAGTLAAAATRMWDHPPIAACAAALIWISLALHESAHGLTCRHYGGHVPEIGVMWRFPLVAPYCKADDVLLFARRWPRVLTAFAGMYVSLLILLPFALAYPLLDAGPIRDAAGGLLLYGSVSALLNLVPFLQLDGYFMLNHALGMVNLRTESYLFCRQLLRRVLRRPGADLAGYPRRIRWIYGLYGSSSVLFGLALAVAAAGYWIARLRAEPPGPVAVVAAGTGALASAAVVIRRRRGRRRVAAGSPA
jgi:putative peptide zinc metalloprotease protein